MDIIYFILRYIPWWAVPCLMMSVQFFRVFKEKELKGLPALCLLAAGVNTLFIVYYIWAGSPDRSVHYFKVLVDSL